MALEDQVATLVARNASLFAAYENFSNGQTALVVGSRNDPDSFDRYGLKEGPLGYYPVLNASGELIFVPCIDRVRADAEAATADAAAGADSSRQQAEAAADRADLAQEIVQDDTNAFDTIEAGRAAVAIGNLFRVFDSNGTIRTYRKTSETTQEEKRVAKSSPLIDDERQAADIAVKRTSRPSPAMARQWRVPAVDSPDGPVDYFDPLTRRRVIEGIVQPPRIIARGGKAPILVGEDPDTDDWPLWWDRFSDRFGIARPLAQPLPDAAMHGGFPSLAQADSSVLAGTFFGRAYQFQDRRLSGPIIMGDNNQVDQLFDIVEGQNGDTIAYRQLTFSQHGVSAMEPVLWPTANAHGLIRISVRDHNALTSRHKARYAVWPRTVSRSPAVPTKMYYFVGLGQSLAVSAGSFDNNPSGVGGPQTVKPQQSFRYGPWTHRNLTWNGGTIPHQGDLNGQHIVAGGGYARDVPIDPARIASFVPMVEGLGQAGADVEGGWRRESIFSALAAQLNAPHNFNGSVYIAGASFGFGSVPFQDLIWDGSTLKQSVQNALSSITKAKALCDAAGVQLVVHYYLNHGQANQSDTTYKSRLEGAWSAIKTATQAITGQSEAMQLWLTQNTAARGTFAEPAYSALAQVEFATEQADVHLLPPDYFTDFEIDTVHMKAPEYQWCGQLWGEVIADWMIRGQDAALMMTGASWTGSTMRLTFNHPVAFDPHNIVLGANACGAGHANSNGATRTISRARLDPAADDVVILDLSSAIPTDAVEVARMAYGNQTSPAAQTMGWGGAPSGGGQRSIIRRADWGERFGVIDGRPLMIFAAIQQIPATKE